MCISFSYLFHLLRIYFRVAIGHRDPPLLLPFLCLATTNSPSLAHRLFPSRLLDPNLAGTMATGAPMEPCLGRIQGACRVALDGVVCTEGLFQRQVAMTGPVWFWPAAATSSGTSLLTFVNKLPADMTCRIWYH